MTEKLKVGDKMPPFFVKDHEGYDVKDVDVLGTPVVIYFYPKDETPGCTKEACAFRDQLGKFDVLQTLVLGVSPDSVSSHQKFVENHGLEFSLLSDPEKEMSEAFCALDDSDDIIRSTFVVNAAGIIVWIEQPVKLDGHIERVIGAVKEHCQDEVIYFENFQKDYKEFLEGSIGMNADEREIEEQIKKEFGIKKRDEKGK